MLVGNQETSDQFCRRSLRRRLCCAEPTALYRRTRAPPRSPTVYRIGSCATSRAAATCSCSSIQRKLRESSEISFEPTCRSAPRLLGTALLSRLTTRVLIASVQASDARDHADNFLVGERRSASRAVPAEEQLHHHRRIHAVPKQMPSQRCDRVVAFARR